MNVVFGLQGSTAQSVSQQLANSVPEQIPGLFFDQIVPRLLSQLLVVGHFVTII
jgi:hypothetical protein